MSRPLLAGATAMLGGFGLAAFYILPAAWEQRWVQISQALTENLRPAQNFLFTHSNDPEFVLFNWKVSAVALGTILITALATVFAARRRRTFLQLWWTLLALAAASVFLMFPPSLFLWQHLPKLQFVQFPWRWLLPLDVAFAFFVAAVLQTPRKQWLGWAAILIATGALGSAFVRDTWWDSEDIPVLMNAIRSQHGYEGTDEYEPLGSDRYQLPGQPPASADDSDESSLNESALPAAPKIATIDPESDAPESDAPSPTKDENAHIDRWSAETKLFTSKTNQPVALALRLLNYPAWEIKVDGTRRSRRFASRNRTIIASRSRRRTFRGRHSSNVPEDRTAGSAISILSVLLLLGFSTYSRRKSSQGAQISARRAVKT